MPLPPAQPSLLQALSLKRDQARDEFLKKHAFAQKWLSEKGLTPDQVRKHSTRLLTGATLSGVLLLSSPQLVTVGHPPINRESLTTSKFLTSLDSLTLTQLTAADEAQILHGISEHYSVAAAFELDRQRIPVNTGIMGLEQHLMRSFDDELSKHGAFIDAGMAPRLGAFGYFSEAGKTEAQIETEERFYIVLQTFLIKNWDRDWFALKDWYKFRKFLVISPETGKAVVAVLGDSGPAPWTGKQFGGSPEVMAALGFLPRETKGKVVVLYLDDPGNSIPLGPLNLSQ